MVPVLQGRLCNPFSPDFEVSRVLAPKRGMVLATGYTYEIELRAYPLMVQAQCVRVPVTLTCF